MKKAVRRINTNGKIEGIIRRLEASVGIVDETRDYHARKFGISLFWAMGVMKKSVQNPKINLQNAKNTLP